MSSSVISNPPAVPAENPADPSMEDILASIRRILSEDEAAAEAPPDPAPDAVTMPVLGGVSIDDNEDDDVLVLDDTMRVAVPPPPAPVMAPPPPSPPVIVPPAPPIAAAPATQPDRLLDSQSELAAAASVGELMRSLSSERHSSAWRGGPTLEDMVLETMRPMLKSWLDQHLPAMVERLVRQEIERVTARVL